MQKDVIEAGQGRNVRALSLEPTDPGSESSKRQWWRSEEQLAMNARVPHCLKWYLLTPAFQKKENYMVVSYQRINRIKTGKLIEGKRSNFHQVKQDESITNTKIK